MKFIFLTFVLFCLTANARQNWFPVGKSGAHTSYYKKSLCEEKEQAQCYDITGKDLRRWKVGQVDDESKPVYRLPEQSPVKIDCDDMSDCSSKAIVRDENGDVVSRACESEEDSREVWDDLANHQGVTGVAGPWFIWCQKRIGWGKKDALVPDPAGAAQADAEDAAKSQEAQRRKSKRNQRHSDLLACATKGGGLSDAEKSDCIKALAKELMRGQLKESEL